MGNLSNIFDVLQIEMEEKVISDLKWFKDSISF